MMMQDGNGVKEGLQVGTDQDPETKIEIEMLKMMSLKLFRMISIKMMKMLIQQDR